LLCRFARFLRELHQEHPKIDMFRENSDYKLKYRKHYKCPEIISNYSNTPLFCW
jgi:hypothetical protein